MQVQVLYTDPLTNSQRQPWLETPIALGRDFNAMPALVDDQRVSRLVIDSPAIASYQALLTVVAGQVTLIDQTTGTATPVYSGDYLSIGSYRVQVQLVGETVSSPVVSGPPAVSATAGCTKVVGFLFPRRCGRTDPAGCPHCRSGRLEQDPYFYYPERSLYPDYGNYGPGHWGYEYYASTSGGSISAIDFTEADAVSLQTMDVDFEQDMGAS